MANGYTSKVAEGKLTSLREFIIHHAASLDMDMRYAGPNDNIFTVDRQNRGSNYIELLYKAEQALLEYVTLTEEERVRRAAEQLIQNTTQRNADRARQLLERERLQVMLQKVNEWNGPLDLKQVMVKSLDDSIRWIVSPKPTRPVSASELKSYTDSRLEFLRQEVEHYRQQYDKQLQEFTRKQVWLAELWASLPSET